MADPTDITFTRHEGRRGFEWVRLAYRMFRGAPWRWLALAGLYVLVIIACRFLPFVGGLAPFLVKPLLSVGFLAGAWRQERGERPIATDLLRGFRSNVWALLPLGVIFVVGSGLAIAATALIDQGRLLGLMIDPAPADLDQEASAQRITDTLADPKVHAGMLFAAVCMVPTLLALWWAPALVVFQDAGVVKALRASFRAAAANWRALLRYCLVVFFFFSLFQGLVNLLIFAVVPEALVAYVATAVFAPYALCVIAVVQISDYISYRDVFHAGETVTPVDRTQPVT